MMPPLSLAMAALVMSLLLVVPARPAAGAERVVTLVGDPWPPYIEGELGQDAGSGRFVELAARIFERIEGVEVRLPLIPWNRALRAVEDGSHDGIAMLLKTPERERYLVYSRQVYASQALVWFSAQRFPGGFDWRRIEDLQAYAVGVTAGYSYGDSVDTAISEGTLRVIKAPTVEQLFAMLARGRLDLALANDGVGFSLARRHPEANIAPAERATGEDVYFMAFSRKSSAVELIPRINEILLELEHEGVIEAVMRPR